MRAYISSRAIMLQTSPKYACVCGARYRLGNALHRTAIDRQNQASFEDLKFGGHTTYVLAGVKSESKGVNYAPRGNGSMDRSGNIRA